ncbi:MAG: hypothetical protein IJ523_10660 [Succinivibrionaceae bacterium]|nr:hypothetical protein [Succinivibrionaceae bacterium]
MPDWIVKYWVQWLFGLVIAALGAAYKHLANRVKKEREEREVKAKQDAEEIKALKNGMRSILRRQIIADCETAQQDEYCDTTTKDTIKDMYDSYHALGGNGVVSALVTQTMNLPSVRKDDSHED